MAPVNINRVKTLYELVPDGEYKSVLASQTTQILGGNGAAGDILYGLLIVPAVVAAGSVTLFDGATSIPIYVAGTSLGDIKPIHMPLNLVSVNGPWKVTTGANVSVVACGKFSN